MVDSDSTGDRLTAREAAASLGRSISSFYVLATLLRLPYIVHNDRRYYQSSDIQEARQPRTRPDGITLTDLIAAGVLQPPLKVEHSYHNRSTRAYVDITAHINEDGIILLGETSYVSVSAAAAAAVESVKGARPGAQRKQQANGWTFWTYVDGQGERHTLDYLRTRYEQARRP